VSRLNETWVYASILHFMNDFATALVPAIVLTLRSEFSLSYADQGLLVTMPTLVAVLLQTFTGHLADRVHASRIILACSMLLGFGTALMGLSHSYGQLLISACIVGLGASFTHPTIYSVTSSQYAGLEGRYLGFVSAAGDVSLPVVFAATQALAGVTGWRVLMLCYGLLTVSIGVALYKASSKTTMIKRAGGGAAPGCRMVKQLVKPLVVLGLVSSCHRVVLAFTTTYLNRIGLSAELANYVFAAILSVGVMGPVLTGVLLKSGREMRAVALEMAVISALSVSVAATSNPALASVLLVPVGVLILSAWPPVYSTISRSSPREHMGLTYGASLTFAWAFGSAWPYIAGIIADAYGISTAYLLVAALLVTAAVIATTAR
jgi:MFS family permease